MKGGHDMGAARKYSSNTCCRYKRVYSRYATRAQEEDVRVIL
jgi:hypothetical protein